MFLILFTCVFCFGIAEFEPYYAVTNTKTVNMRLEPDSKSKLVMQIQTKGTKVTVHNIEQDKSGKEWAKVETHLGKKGYILTALLTKVAGNPANDATVRPSTITNGNGLYTSWFEAYRDFILGGKYKSWKGPKTQDFFWIEDKISPPRFSLYDMDRDGIPELLGGGNEAMAGNCYRVFTFRNGRIVYCGEAGFRECRLYTIAGTNYTGLFCHEGLDRVRDTVYYNLKNDTVVGQRVWECEYKFILQEDDAYTEEPDRLTRYTDDIDLYDASFTHDIWKVLSYTESQIRKMGWDTFIQGNLLEYHYIDDWLAFYFDIGF